MQWYLLLRLILIKFCIYFLILINIFIITETLLSPNPSVTMMFPNSTIFLLEWSPPFLWPGYHVEHFNIIITNLKNDRVIPHDCTTVNASFDDIIVSLTIEPDAYLHDLCTCTEFLFTIFAVGPDQVELPPFSVIGRYLSREWFYWPLLGTIAVQRTVGDHIIG